LGEITFRMLTDARGEEMVVLRTRLLGDVRDVRGVERTAAWERQLVRGAGGDAQLGASNALNMPGASSGQDLVGQLLDPAAERYERGALWLEMARDAREGTARAGYVALATNLLTQARELARTTPSAAQGTPQQQELLDVIAAALEDAQIV
jgi:hypothetical protein